jgi:hypothetical protein
LVGDYYAQDIDYNVATKDDTPSAYRAYLSVDQEAHGFTSLWIEYAKYEKDFHIVTNDPYAWYIGVGSDLAYRLGQGDSTVYNVYATQKWNDKWGTYVRWLKVKTDGVTDDYTNWTAAVNYWYTPNVVFELGYDKYEDGHKKNDSGVWEEAKDDDMIWLRTTVFF